MKAVASLKRVTVVYLSVHGVQKIVHNTQKVTELYNVKEIQKLNFKVTPKQHRYYTNCLVVEIEANKFHKRKKRFKLDLQKQLLSKNKRNPHNNMQYKRHSTALIHHN